MLADGVFPVRVVAVPPGANVVAASAKGGASYGVARRSAYRETAAALLLALLAVVLVDALSPYPSLVLGARRRAVGIGGRHPRSADVTLRHRPRPAVSIIALY